MWLDLAHDSRGNRLEDFKVTHLPDESEFYVELRSVPEIADQVGLVLQRLSGGARVSLRDLSWSHRLRFDGPYRRWLLDYLELLKEVVTLTPVPELAAGTVLDFYKIPDDTRPPAEWDNTPAGDLVNRAKYWGELVSGKRLADQMADVVNKNPLYGAATIVLAVPGTERQFGERLAQAVGHRVGKPVVTARRLSPAEAPAKQGHASRGFVSYRVDCDLTGEEVIVVDDVYRSGTTMRGVAAAARASGARLVLGLAGARTMRKT